MILVSGEMEFTADDFAEAKDAALVLVTASQREDGCLAYRFSEDVTVPNMLCFYEEWESLEALELHKSTYHNKQFRRSLDGLSMIARVVRKYNVDPTKSIY